MKKETLMTRNIAHQVEGQLKIELSKIHRMIQISKIYKNQEPTKMMSKKGTILLMRLRGLELTLRIKMIQIISVLRKGIILKLIFLGIPSIQLTSKKNSPVQVKKMSKKISLRRQRTRKFLMKSKKFTI